MIVARSIVVRGVVQGVGFRPFVFRVARELGIRGWVLNDADGVRIHAEADAADIDALVRTLRDRPPAAAVVSSVHTHDACLTGADAFVIRQSGHAAAPTVRVSPDLAVCQDCLRELRDPADPRHRYEYINCTNCGPRYSIVVSLPYDRPGTTMRGWPLCEACERQYHDPADRRFHAQPTACPRCGPRYSLVRAGETLARGVDAVVRAASMLRDGAVIAVKGIGGYHLACDARRTEVVAALRTRKFRKDKPFAVLARSVEQARELCVLSDAHEAELRSTAAPIVLAPARAELPGVAPGLDELGVMLPYAPLHWLLIDAGAPTPMVLTSANRSNEPICFRDEDAFERLSLLADAFLVGDRPIARRVDDSVVAVRRGRRAVIRRARGLAPAVVATLPAGRPILALGADLKNAVALVVRGEVIMSQHIGDLGDPQTDLALDDTVRDLLAMYGLSPFELTIAHDQHPQFASTARALALGGARLIAVQHHHAHAASVLAEQGLLDEPAVVLALDGTGWAPAPMSPGVALGIHGAQSHEGEIWGGEVLLGSVRSGFKRVSHLRTAPQPGGDAAARFPVQAAAGRLHGMSGLPGLSADPFRLPARFESANSMIEKGVRCFASSSTGRLFDAAAALLGFLEPVTYEGQAAIWLEQLARRGSGETLWPLDGLDDRPILRALIAERIAARPIEDIALAFHRTLAEAFAASASHHARLARVATVALTGGVCQNALLTQFIEDSLRHAGLRVIQHEHVPCNDGGIALGQAAIASFR